MTTFKPTLVKEYFAYLVKQHMEIQFVWTDESDSLVSLSYYTRSDLSNTGTMTKSEARDFWTVLKKRGYAKGVKCSTHLVK